MGTLNPKNLKKKNGVGFISENAVFGKREYLCKRRNNGRNPESPDHEFNEPPFPGFISPQQNVKFAQETLAMQHMLNIGMFEQKTPLRERSRQCFFLEFNKLPNRTHGQSLDVSTFIVGRMLVFPSAARVTLLGGSQSVKIPLEQIQNF